MTKRQAFNVAPLLPVVGQWIDERSLAPNTERAYRYEASRFLQWLSTAPSADGGRPGLEQLATFLEWVANPEMAKGDEPEKAAPTVGSINQAKRIVGSFLRKAAALDLANPDVIDGYGRSLSAKVMRAVRPTSAAADGADVRLPPSGDGCTTADDRRVSLIAQLAFWAGANREEISALRCGDLDFSRHGCKVRIADTRRGVTSSWLPSTFVHDLDALHQSLPYDASRKNADLPVVPMLTRPEPVTAWMIYKILSHAEHSAAAKPKGIVSNRNLRCLRGGFIKMALRNLWSSDEVAVQLRRTRVALGESGRQVRIDVKRVQALSEHISSRNSRE